MKRLLVLLAFAAGILSVSACHYNVSLTVNASADLTFQNGTLLRTEQATYTGFHDRNLPDSDLEWVFTELTQGLPMDGFASGILYLQIFDEGDGSFLREESYGVLYDNRTGRYAFADLARQY